MEAYKLTSAIITLAETEVSNTLQHFLRESDRCILIQHCTRLECSSKNILPTAVITGCTICSQK